jgi:hypothetical protein
MTPPILSRYGPTGHTLAISDDDRCEVTTPGWFGDDQPIRCLLKPHDPATGHLGNTRGKQRFRWWPEEENW